MAGCSEAFSAAWSEGATNDSPSQESLLTAHNMSYINDTSSEDFVLSDGRKLGVAYYGATSGPAVFYLHGFPGCRLSGGAFFDAHAKEQCVRIIAVERPGLGLSSPQPGRKLTDHATDIHELAAHLNLDSYGIVGVSGGGPYALACAYSLPPEKLKSVSVICGMGPIGIGTKGMSWSNWFIFKGFKYFPFLIRWLQGKVYTVLNTVTNAEIIEAVGSRLSERSYSWVNPDFEMVSDPTSLNMLLDFYREHYRQGVDGHMEEGRVLTSDWGFRLEDIRSDLPIQLWYSRKDRNVPFRMGEVIAERLGSRPEFFVKEQETHLKLVLTCAADALQRLVKNM
jgi:pimeloyl-ACP methyl ester carboxylesterase